MSKNKIAKIIVGIILLISVVVLLYLTYNRSQIQSVVCSDYNAICDGVGEFSNVRLLQYIAFGIALISVNTLIVLFHKKDKVEQKDITVLGNESEQELVTLKSENDTPVEIFEPEIVEEPIEEETEEPTEMEEPVEEPVEEETEEPTEVEEPVEEPVEEETEEPTEMEEPVEEPIEEETEEPTEVEEPVEEPVEEETEEPTEVEEPVEEPVEEETEEPTEVEEPVEEPVEEETEEPTEVEEPVEEPVEDMLFSTAINRTSSKNQKNYEEIREHIMSYSNIESEVSLLGETYMIDGVKIARISLLQNVLKIHIRADVKAYPKHIFHHINYGHLIAYQELPFTMRIGSDISKRNIKKVIDDVMGTRERTEALIKESSVENEEEYVVNENALVRKNKYIASKIAESVELSKSESDQLLSVILKVMVKQLGDHDKITLRGFGTFEVKNHFVVSRANSIKVSKDYVKGDMVEFRPSKNLHESLNDL